MKVFYHNDMDGIVSAQIILDFMTDVESKECKEEDFIKMDYTKKFPLDKIKEKEEVYIVDYSIDPAEMKQLLELTPRVVWIDHHISAIEKYKNSDLDYEAIRGLRANGIAGCVLTYWYFYGRMSETDEFIASYPKNLESRFRKLIPMYIKLAGDWDIWEHLYQEATKKFTICFSTMINSPFDKVQFDKIKTEDGLNDFYSYGALLLDYRTSWAKEFMARYGFETQIEGHSAFVANLGNANSEYFGNLINKYDIIGTFCFNGEKWTISLYSNKDYINCAEICARNGGGGHKGAAGYVTDKISFKKEEKNV